MAKFKSKFSAYSGGDFSGEAGFSELSSEDMLSVLRPAAEMLKEHYKTTIQSLFQQRTGDLADSIKTSETGLDRQYMNLSEASISVGPTGKRNKSKRKARSRAGSSSRRYAKHNRIAGATNISNAELGYLLEYGTARITATHWMENANEQIADSLQEKIAEEFNKMMESKGM